MRGGVSAVAQSNADGPVAQLGARFHGMEEVVSSNLTRSTKNSGCTPKTGATPIPSRQLTHRALAVTDVRTTLPSPTKTRYRVEMGMSDMPDPRYNSAKRSVQALGPADQLRLIAELAASLRGEVERQPRRSLLELQGLGKEVWQGVDVEEYLRRERSSWNG